MSILHRKSRSLLPPTSMNLAAAGRVSRSRSSPPMESRDATGAAALAVD
jgi:hypothetical protein